MIASLYSLLLRLKKNSRGNVFMLFAFAVVPMVFATGMGIDYARAARLQTKLNAVADAAALAAVAQPAMNDPSDQSATKIATDMFNAQAAGLEGLDSYVLNSIKIEHLDGPTSRTVTVSYSAKSLNAFGGVLNMRTISIGGSSTATATAAPNMDFYIALDTSPSMALPTTQSGIDVLDGALKCSFACHSNKIEGNYSTSSTASVKGLIRDIPQYHIDRSNKPANSTGTVNGYAIEKLDASGAYVYKSATVNQTLTASQKAGNGALLRDLCRLSSTNLKDVCVYNADGTLVDSYWYALNQGLHLRVTDERAAVQDLMALAKSYAQVNQRIYRASLYTFDHSTRPADKRLLVSIPADKTYSNLDAVSAAASSVELVTVNDKSSNGCPPAPATCTSTNKYLFTSFKTLLDDMAGVNGGTGILPKNSGKGSNGPTDTPQGYLFIVTDGISDEQSSLLGPKSLVPWSLTADRTRSEIVQAHIDQCNKIKARGFKIAILYTEYTADSIKDDEQQQRDYVTNNLPDVVPALTACASNDLMYTVKTDQSISAALQALFAKAIANARLNK